ncbi:hypothetical protein PhCBS80983_g04277 [Powellomyces hirtus]|uniref:Histone deacetylase complex subunit SAP30 Sin3 binding domain-containing protein n=1 Tax=Powellomyces hirtus TaxID=109895 RepID=A0A507DYR6_9FUNG|nr:hypothetical protein DFJ77DRAFT_540822 [Powellomyces hirtus]TPX56794.1 hypothetical protein PhCBS80983_g04277 [Powellomyces hirtus]
MNSKPKSTSGAHHLATSGPTTHKADSHKKKPTTAASSTKHTITKKPDDYVSQIDFSTMEDKILKRYKRTFKLRAKSSRERDRETRDDLVSSVTKHFNSYEVNEKDMVTSFIYALRNQDNIYKLPPKAPIATS